jgi:hypothetical protein
MKRQQKSTAARGYGGHHQALRKQWKVKVDSGQVYCGKCHKLIPPDSRWALSHPNDDKMLPAVPWHEKCNARYATTVTKPRRNRQKVTPREVSDRPPGWRSPDGRPWSRDWGGGHWSD